MKWNSRVTYVTVIIAFRVFECLNYAQNTHSKCNVKELFKDDICVSIRRAQQGILMNTEKDAFQVNRFSMEIILQRII